MKINLIIIPLIFCFLSLGEASAQPIQINYETGCRCGVKINGEEIVGNCSTFEQLEYSPKKHGKYFKSNKLECKREVRQYENGKFGINLEKDSLKVFRINKNINSKEFNLLIAYLNLVENSFIDTIETTKFFQKLPMANWDENTYELNKREIRKISNKYNQLSKDSIIHTINKYIIEENEGLLVSSVIVFLLVSFEHENKRYSIFQYNLGGVTTSWNVDVNDKMYRIISPELNKILSPFLAKKMRAKKALTQFLNIKTLEKAFIKE